MPVDIIVGAQWGDEGKGKIIDTLGVNTDYVIRFGGGNNAGHTIKVDGESFILHLLPSGVLHKHSKCLLGAGMVIDFKVFLQEIASLEACGFDTEHIFISSRAHLIMPYHIILDSLWEGQRTDKIGTTKRGIGPCYSDKYARLGIRTGDLLDGSFPEKLKNILKTKNDILTKIFNENPLDYDSILSEYNEITQKVSHRIINTETEVQNALAKNKNILLEGAQAMMLDIDYGSYPYVTSSSPTAAGGTVGSGISPRYIRKIIGVCKAYSTRVGEGPFVTEQNNAQGEWLRSKGSEYGSTTGRPRRCGWLDLVVLRYACEINGFTEIALTKLDVLSGLKEIPICVGYELEGEKISGMPASVDILAGASAVYETMPGWNEDISNCKTLSDLPGNARRYIEKMETHTGCPIRFVSVGAGREQFIAVE